MRHTDPTDQLRDRIKELTLTLRDQAHLHKMETTGLRKVIEELEAAIAERNE